jgi:hypothetical protein
MILPLIFASALATQPTFCAEWVRQSREGYERLTLFADRTLVWKTSRAGTGDVRRKKLPAEEADFYCSYFARPELWEIPEDARTHLSGDFAVQSSIALTRPDGSRKDFRFDDFSALNLNAAAVRSALEGLKGLFTNPIAPASRFTAEALPPGTLLRRLDGVLFRVRGIHGGHAEMEGVEQPYRFFIKLEELRFQFSPPE